MRLLPYCCSATLALLACAPQDDNAPSATASVGQAVVQPGTAEYDTGLHVPVCSQVSNLCDSTTLVEGRGPMGPEPHAPNTLDGCADGTTNDPMNHPEQIHWIKVSRADGGLFVAGRRVRVDVAVQVPDHSFYETPPTVDLYSASDATAPVWTYQGMVSLDPNLYPEKRGLQVVSLEYVLPSGSLQAVRARFSTYHSMTSPCGTSSTDDQDDLAFAVGQEGDVTPPTVSITAPTNDAPVNSGVTVQAVADDNFSVTRVEFYEGETLLGADSTAPFSAVWYNGLQPDGSRHTLTAKAYDAAGNVTTSAPVSVIVDNIPPSVWSVSLPQDAFVRGTVQLTASASDTNGIRAISYYDGPVEYLGLIGYSTAAPYAVSWNTLETYEGRRGLRIVATDLAGNVSQPAVVGVTVDNTPPTVAITAPASGAKVFLSTTILATASDTNGVTQVAFYDGSKLIGTDTSSPYSVGWSTLLVSKGQHTLTAVAKDVAGNVTSSPGVVVTVQ